jgi:Ca2+/H+ antiporter
MDPSDRGGVMEHGAREQETRNKEHEPQGSWQLLSQLLLLLWVLVLVLVLSS